MGASLMQSCGTHGHPIAARGSLRSLPRAVRQSNAVTLTLLTPVRSCLASRSTCRLSLYPPLGRSLLPSLMRLRCAPRDWCPANSRFRSLASLYDVARRRNSVSRETKATGDESPMGQGDQTRAATTAHCHRQIVIVHVNMGANTEPACTQGQALGLLVLSRRGSASQSENEGRKHLSTCTSVAQ